MDKLVLGGAVLLNVVEGDGVPLDSNFLDEVAELAPSTLTQIVKETMFELAGLLHLSVGVQFTVHT